MFYTLFLVLVFLLLPGSAMAWGPLTHVYLGTEVFYMAALIPVSVYSLLSRFRKDFIYGNLMADATIAKHRLTYEDHPHNWALAGRMYEAAATGHERAFTLGYMGHLAADTVAHGELTRGMSASNHIMKEILTDASMCRSHWIGALNMPPEVRRRGDMFLRQHMPVSLLNFEFNTAVFRAMVGLTGFNRNPFVAKAPSALALDESIDHLGGECVRARLKHSLFRMADVISHMERSTYYGRNAIAHTADGLMVRRATLAEET